MAKNSDKIEDIFSEVDKAQTAKNTPQKPITKNSYQPVKPNSSPLSVIPEGPSTNPKRSKTPVVILLVFIFIILVGMIYLVLTGTILNTDKVDKTASDVNIDLVNNSDQVSNKQTDDTTTIGNDIDFVNLNTGPVDTDGDGLTDEEEKSYGTNPLLADTDGDGLYDREEIKVYDTDPLNADTDGDGQKDGIEVDNGYNPNGSGLLLDLQKTINNL